MINHYASYDEFFRAATGGSAPFPYQARFAEGKDLPAALRVPTGAGKTLTIVLGWLWRRRFHPDAGVRLATPRRLVYMLPQRSLVEQTRDVVGACLAHLGLAETLSRSTDPTGHALSVYSLMGGDVDDEWALYPERAAILIGTQDMTLSRALNRGYAQSRFSWSRAFGLLHSDTLWVADEVQLMGSALSTSVQLQALRDAVGTYGPQQTIWMSATLAPDWLTTVDRRVAPHLVELDDADRQTPVLSKRLSATKTLHHLDIAHANHAALVARVRQVHMRGTRTLIVCNTVQRTREIYDALKKLAQGQRSPGRSRPTALPGLDGDVPDPPPDLLLVHSRYRPAERAELHKRLTAAVDPHGPGMIVVATQVVEAGVDLSARILVTDLAPWASLVQRMGRCNRTGDDQDAAVYWIDVPDAWAAPYEVTELLAAKSTLEERAGCQVAPQDLESGGPPLPPFEGMVLRRRDAWDLFDTTPDLAGADIDVGRFVRDGEERDVQIFWRNWGDPTQPPPEDLVRPHRDELCAAPIQDTRRWLKKTKDLPVYTWDSLDRRWTRVRLADDVRPGLTILAHVDASGYDPERGWDDTHTGPVSVVERPQSGQIGGNIRDSAPEEGTDDDQASLIGRQTRTAHAAETGSWQTLAGHTADVQAELEKILALLPAVELAGPLLRHAALLHDWGKSHDCFQAMLKANARDSEKKDLENPTTDALARLFGTDWSAESNITEGCLPLLAKSPQQGRARHTRPHFRHELASALAVLAEPDCLPAHLSEQERDLIVYLIASHHGKVRLGLRSLPGEKQPDKPEDGRAFALGIWQNDLLPAVPLSNGVCLPKVSLNLTPMFLGRHGNGAPSWLAGTLALRDDPQWGPFRLAYLEAILRAADMRASATFGHASLKTTLKSEVIS